jgi:putative Mg2+ transporter-C (MgtC) family protein
MKDIVLVHELTKLLVALIFGAIIGAEREYKSKAAGFRTVILIMVGSTLFTIVSQLIGGDDRVASNIVTGIGFLGAGSIFREGVNVKGMTTATTIWIAAAIGMTIGLGKFSLAFGSLVIVMLVLLSFTWIQRLIEKKNKVETYHITFDAKHTNDDKHLINLFDTCKLRATCTKNTKINHKKLFVFTVQGPAANHHKLVKMLFEAPYISEFEV